MILPFLFSVPLTLCTVMGSLSSCHPIPSCFQVQKLMKFSVTPLLRRAVCSAVAHAVCTGMERLIIFTHLMYILHVHIAHSQADGFECFKNPDQSQEPQYPVICSHHQYLLSSHHCIYDIHFCFLSCSAQGSSDSNYTTHKPRRISIVFERGVR